MEAAKEEIRRIKEEEEQAMREALGLAPKRSSRPQGNRLDKHEFSELIKRGSTAEDLGEGHAEAVQVQGFGFSRAPKSFEESGSLKANLNAETLPPSRKHEEELDDESGRKKRKHEEKKHEKHEEKKHEKHEKREKRRARDSVDKSKHSRDSDDRRKHKRDKERRRHDSD